MKLTRVSLSSQHVQKLRKNRDTNGITTAAGGSTPITTPSKPSPVKTPKTSGRKRAAAESSKLKLELAKEEDDDDLLDKLIVKEEAMSGVEDTPTKPAKRARNKSTTYVFTELATSTGFSFYHLILTRPLPTVQQLPLMMTPRSKGLLRSSRHHAPTRTSSFAVAKHSSWRPG
jgi:hypothetical protein